MGGTGGSEALKKAANFDFFQHGPAVPESDIF